MTSDLRQSVAAFGLIRRENRGQPEWLAQWNQSWQCYNFVGGHKRKDETFRECVVREVCEELDVREHRDFAVASEPAAHLEYTDFSESACEETAYTIELFEVHLSRNAMLDLILVKVTNRWVTANEITAGATRDGRSVSRTMRRVLARIGVHSGGWAKGDRVGRRIGQSDADTSTHSQS